MGQMVRTTVIGLLNKGVTFEDIQDFVTAKIADKVLTGFKTATGVTCTEDGEERRHVKFSKLSPAQELDHQWNLAISNEFCLAGYGDVAWKFTEVDSEDPYGEITTVSIPPGLFRKFLNEDQDEKGRPALPERFGSEAFWRWFDDRDR